MIRTWYVLRDSVNPVCRVVPQEQVNVPLNIEIATPEAISKIHLVSNGSELGVDLKKYGIKNRRNSELFCGFFGFFILKDVPRLDP